MMIVLLIFTGFHDPCFKGLVDQEEQAGPILSLLSTRIFDHIFIFNAPSTHRGAKETTDAIMKLHQKNAAHILEINFSGSTNCQEIFKRLRTHFSRINEAFASAHFYVAVTSGTSHMQRPYCSVP
ncbi:MAG: hypothetical protein GX117_12875 [Candidatus Hydrogenedentes bacterium]|jgi:hypothetical protein|nr:hypothetical protein [Candidatus Hydrogenedentota bacterium]